MQTVVSLIAFIVIALSTHLCSEEVHRDLITSVVHSKSIIIDLESLKSILSTLKIDNLSTLSDAALAKADKALENLSPEQVGPCEVGIVTSYALPVHTAAIIAAKRDSAVIILHRGLSVDAQLAKLIGKMPNMNVEEVYVVRQDE